MQIKLNFDCLLQVGLHEFPGNLDAEMYVDFLRNTLDGLSENADIDENERQNISWQQDGAPAHRARICTREVTRQFGNQWIGIGAEIPWPANSPDLSPLDFFLWGMLKNKVYCGEPAPNAEELRRRLQAALRDVTPAMITNSKRNFLRRCECCIRIQGGHFENLLNS